MVVRAYDLWPKSSDGNRSEGSLAAVDAVLVSVALVVYSSAANRWPPFNHTLYVPVNVCFAGALTLVALGPLGLSARDIGLRGPLFPDLLLGAGAGAFVAAPLFIALVLPRAARRIADRRVEGLAGGSLAYQVLVRVPVGTALVEELAFRGVLYGLLAGSSTGAAAVLGSAVVFGLWHIVPTINLMEANRPGAPRRALLATIAGAVVVTAAAGALLAVLRDTRGSIWMPVALHASANSLATVAATKAHRRGAGNGPTPRFRARSS